MEIFPYILRMALSVKFTLIFLCSNIHGPWDEAVIKEEHVAA